MPTQRFRLRDLLLAGVSLAVAACTVGLVAEEAAEGVEFAPAAASVDDASLQRLLDLHYTETERVRLVLLPTSVTDRRGRIVRGLEPKHFRVYEDHVPQEISFFSAQAEEPIFVAFLLDVSGSMRQLGKLGHAKEAIRYFVEQLWIRDQFALICFADEQVSEITEFTRDQERFLKRLEVQEGYGRTALNDAVAATPRLVDEKIRGRKAVVLITDGVDNQSRLTTAQAVDLARQVNVPIYTIGFLSVPESSMPKGATETNLDVLKEIAEETGGRMFVVHDLVDLKEAAASLQEELRFQYVIGYYPTRKRANGEFRRIRLEIGKRGLIGRTRSGYYAAP